jgi:hypothetical protein
MAFPQSLLPLHVELDVGGWTDITDDPMRRAGVSITRGRSDEGSTVDRSTCNMEVDNRTGDYSPRNPSGAYYGLLGRNTPLRVSLERSYSTLRLLGTAADRITTPDAAALDITGDIDIRIDLALSNWRRGCDLAGKYETTGNQRSWAFYTHSDHSGRLVLTWSTNGTATITVVSDIPVPAPHSGRQALRVTLDVNNGAAGNTATFYYADTMDGTWTQLGDPVITASTTSIFSSSAVLELGDVEDLSNGAVIGEIYEFKLLNGIAGSEVANPDFTIQTHDDTSFADAAGRTWTVQGGAQISNRSYRFHGEVSSWPQRWDNTGEDVSTPLEASGIMRRLTQGATVEGSVMYRASLRDTSGLVAYWPLEDPAGSQRAASATDNTLGLSYTGTPEFATYEGFVASNPIMRLNGAQFNGSVPNYTVGNESQWHFLMNVPSGGAEDGQVVLMWYTTGSVRRWEVFYGTGGTLGLRAFDSGGTQLFTTGAVAFAVNGLDLLVAVELTQNGADIDYALATLEPGESSGLQTSGTLTTDTVGKVGQFQISPSGGIDAISIGHLTFQNDVTSLFELGTQLNGWKGETAGRRIERLCSEESITFTAIGDIDDTVTLGVQMAGPLMDLIRGCVETDLGMLYEPRDVLGLGYRTRASLCNQDARVTLDYSAAELASAPLPTDDDQQTENDVTVQRQNGSSARAVLETGPLSVLTPPDGVGRYDTSVTVEVEYDAMLFDQASWRLFLGTVDEARYPQLHINMARSQIAGNATLFDNLRLAEVGDRVVIQNMPSFIPPEDISQLVQGYTETLNNFEFDLVFNCSPESPYQAVAIYGNATDEGPDRYQAEDSAISEDLTTTETDVSVATTTGPLWTTDADEVPFDIMIGGERMTVTAISGASSPQTFTVTRSVNGVVKTHTTGAAVRLFEPAVYGM